MESLQFLILTVSDSCSKGCAEDHSGLYLKKAIETDFKDCVVNSELVADDINEISVILKLYVDNKDVDVILTTGGTGFSPRDVTPQATKNVIDYEAPGITVAMAVKSLEITPMAMLSRSVAGVRGKTLIINFPGSKKAAAECYNVVKPIFSHAVALLRNELGKIQRVHESLSVNNTHLQDHEVILPRIDCHHSHQNCSKVDVTRVAYRQRESSYTMFKVSEAKKVIIDHVQLNLKRVKIQQSLDNCLNYVLAEDAKARDPLPPFPASIKDGYACLYEDGVGNRIVIGAILAGDVADRALKPGECSRINTGAPIPPGANCVVQVEDTKVVKHSEDGREELSIEVMVAPKFGQDIRPVGSDVAQNEVILRKGTFIGAPEVGLLATVGLTNVPVYKHPTIGVLSTGNELQSPADFILKPGHIRDSNKSLLIAMMRENGLAAFDFGVVRDEPTEMKTALEQALSKVDVLITTGSVSMGDRDILKPILEKDLNATVHFGRVTMKPGKPTTFATCRYEDCLKYIFCLPGNPVSAYVTCTLFVLPALRLWMGCTNYEFTRIYAQLDEDVKLDPRPEYARGLIKTGNDSPCPKVSLTGNQISSRLTSVTGSHLLLELPSSNDGPNILTKGTVISALVIGRI